jgi:hypothetical protein
VRSRCTRHRDNGATGSHRERRLRLPAPRPLTRPIATERVQRDRSPYRPMRGSGDSLTIPKTRSAPTWATRLRHAGSHPRPSPAGLPPSRHWVTPSTSRRPCSRSRPPPCLLHPAPPHRLPRPWASRSHGGRPLCALAHAPLLPIARAAHGERTAAGAALATRVHSHVRPRTTLAIRVCTLRTPPPLLFPAAHEAPPALVAPAPPPPASPRPPAPPPALRPIDPPAPNHEDDTADTHQSALYNPCARPPSSTVSSSIRRAIPRRSTDPSPPPSHRPHELPILLSSPSRGADKRP